MSSSPAVAECEGLPAATLARASAGEFFTGEYAAHTWVHVRFRLAGLILLHCDINSSTSCRGCRRSGFRAGATALSSVKLWYKSWSWE